MNLKHLCGACLLGGALALKMGAPLISVMTGIGLTVAWNVWKKRERRTQ